MQITSIEQKRAPSAIDITITVNSEGDQFADARAKIAFEATYDAIRERFPETTVTLNVVDEPPAAERPKRSPGRPRTRAVEQPAEPPVQQPPTPAERTLLNADEAA